MNNLDLSDQLCAKVAQYIKKCDCDEYPKFELCNETDIVDNTLDDIHYKIHISKDIYYEKKFTYGSNERDFIDCIANFWAICQNVPLHGDLNEFQDWTLYGYLYYNHVDNQLIIKRPVVGSTNHYNQMIYRCKITDNLLDTIKKFMEKNKNIPIIKEICDISAE